MQESTVPVPSPWRVLGEAVCFALIAPVLLFLLDAGVTNVAGVRVWRGLLLSVGCSTFQIVALSKLKSGTNWKFGLAKAGRYLLIVVAFLSLLLFGEWAVIAGYYLLHPGATPLFGGT